MTWAIPSLHSEKFRKPERPKKVFLLENVIFWGPRLVILVNKPLKALCLMRYNQTSKQTNRQKLKISIFIIRIGTTSQQ